MFLDAKLELDLPGVGQVWNVPLYGSSIGEVDIDEMDEEEQSEAAAQRESLEARSRLYAVRSNGKSLWTNDMTIAREFIGTQFDLFA